MKIRKKKRTNKIEEIFLSHKIRRNIGHPLMTSGLIGSKLVEEVDQSIYF